MKDLLAVSVMAVSAVLSEATCGQASALPLSSAAPVIEHAEIIQGAEGTADQAFLTIWNGTAQEKLITGVRVTGYDQIKLVRSGESLADRYSSDIVDAALTIPRNSEIYMKPSTVFLSIERAGALPSIVEIEVEIDNSYMIKSIVALKPSGSRVTSHHHGEAKDE